MTTLPQTRPVILSIGIMAWNEERRIVRTLESLFAQSVFERLAARGQRCEIVVVANACTDRTVAVCEELFARVQREHPAAAAIVARVCDIPEPGKPNAWNRFVHEFSAVEARFICSMDADIVFQHRDTIHNLVAVLEADAHALASTGRQVNDVALKPRRSLAERISLGASAISGGAAGKICGQLYCLRAPVARNIFLPRDIGSIEDGFIKEMVCTQFLTAPSDPTRIVLAPDAAHVFEAYVGIADVLNNQKRQMMGQTGTHVLIEFLKSLPRAERENLGATLRRHELRDPDWLKKKIGEHLRARPFFWQIIPGVLTYRLRRWWRLPAVPRITHAPAAAAGLVVAAVACIRAHRTLRRGLTRYWPKVERPPVLDVPLGAK